MEVAHGHLTNELIPPSGVEAEIDALNRFRTLSPSTSPSPLTSKSPWWTHAFKVPRTVLRFFFHKAELVREVGPGELPLERHEWERRDPMRPTIL